MQFYELPLRLHMFFLRSELSHICISYLSFKWWKKKGLVKIVNLNLFKSIILQLSSFLLPKQLHKNRMKIIVIIHLLKPEIRSELDVLNLKTVLCLRFLNFVALIVKIIYLFF